MKKPILKFQDVLATWYLSMTSLRLFHSGPKNASSSMTSTAVRPIIKDRSCSQLRVPFEQAVHTSSVRHGIRTQNKVTELQEYQTGNY